MTRAQREMLVERYMEFEMSPQEEGEFIMQAATDADLLRTLHAYRLVHRSLANSSRAHLGNDDPREHADAMALLAALHEARPATDTKPLPAESGRVGSIWNNRLVQSAGRPILYALLGFVAGLYSGSKDDVVSTAPVANPAAATPQTSIPSRQSTTSRIELPALDQEVMDRSFVSPEDTTGRSRRSTAGANTRSTPGVAPPGTQGAKRVARPVDPDSSIDAPRGATPALVPRSNIEPITVQKDRDTVTFKARGLRPQTTP